MPANCVKCAQYSTIHISIKKRKCSMCKYTLIALILLRTVVIDYVQCSLTQYSLAGILRSCLFLFLSLTLFFFFVRQIDPIRIFFLALSLSSFIPQSRSDARSSDTSLLLIVIGIKTFKTL